MHTLKYNQARFLLSVAKMDQLPPDEGAEVAFCGRSNSGKSSALNAITQQNHLARTSKTPGRTQLLNFFTVGDPDHRLVDLPGYGFAKVSAAVKLHWEQLLEAYFQERQSLKGLILLMDIRHPLMDSDRRMIDWTLSLGFPIRILLTKADKLKRGAASQVCWNVQKALASLEDQVSVQLFSSVSHQGLEESRKVLDAWLGSASD